MKCVCNKTNVININRKLFGSRCEPTRQTYIFELWSVNEQECRTNVTKWKICPQRCAHFYKDVVSCCLVLLLLFFFNFCSFSGLWYLLSSCRVTHFKTFSWNAQIFTLSYISHAHWGPKTLPLHHFYTIRRFSTINICVFCVLFFTPGITMGALELSCILF